MEAVRDKWTDERLDDLNRKVDGGFARVGARFGQVDERFGRLEARLDGIQKTMLHGFFWLVGIQVTFFVSTIGFIAAPV